MKTNNWKWFRYSDIFPCEKGKRLTKADMKKGNINFIGATDSKRMLDAYIHYCMHKKSKEREVKFAKAAVDFSNELTHNRTATAMDAELCYNAVLSTVHIIRTLNKYND